MKYLSLDIETTGLRREDPEDMDSVLSVGLVADDLQNPQPIDELPRAHIILDVSNEVLTGNIVAFTMNMGLLERIAALNKKVKKQQASYDTLYTPAQIEYFTQPRRVVSLIDQFVDTWGLRDTMSGPINVAGKNVLDFDVKFLNNRFGLHHRVKARRRPLDPSILYMMPGDTAVPSLETCNERAGFRPEGVAHQALDDALNVVELIRLAFNIAASKDETNANPTQERKYSYDGNSVATVA